MIAAIIAGGKGTRLGLSDIPKPMVEINNIPLLHHQIHELKKYGVDKVFILCGHLSEKIKEYFNNKKPMGIEIEYIVEPHPLGTAGCIKQLQGKVNERFLILLGDIIFNIDLNRFIQFDKKDSIATITAHPNNHPHDSDLIELDPDNRIIALHAKPHDENIFYRNIVPSGLYILSPEIFDYIHPELPSDLARDIFPKILHKKMYAHVTSEYLKDIGTPDRLEEARYDHFTGKIQRLNLQNKRKAIFIDRDGTINKFVNDLSDINKFELLPNVPEAIHKINCSEYLAIIITNQPGVAKGFLTESVLYQMHCKMDTLLGKEHAFIDKVYYCPHHPNKGFTGEIPELKIPCECRKPKAGLFFQAQRDFNIDLNNSWMIGDAEIDMIAGKAAGCSTAFLCGTDLLGAVNGILR